jgi:hypothetical protein
MRSVHFGDPETLKDVFYGELWRGRDNVKVTFRGPKTFAHLRSALIAIVELMAAVAGLIALVLGDSIVAAACAFVVLSLIALRAALLIQRQPKPTPWLAAQALTLVTVFDVARALALVFQGSHRARRSSDGQAGKTASGGRIVVRDALA